MDAVLEQPKFKTNQEVISPVGRGVAQFRLDDDAGVRVACSGSATDSRCLTPQAVKTSLWVFLPWELEAVR